MDWIISIKLCLCVCACVTGFTSVYLSVPVPVCLLVSVALHLFVFVSVMSLRHILYRTLPKFTTSYWTIQLSYLTRKFQLEYSMSAPVRSSVHWNGTHPILKTFLRFFELSEFRSSGRLQKHGIDLYNFFTNIENLCCWHLNWLEDIQLSYREMWIWRI